MTSSTFVPEVFGRLTTLDSGYIVNFGTYKKKCHMVRCECGTEKQVRRGDLLSGLTRSCGCLSVDTVKEMRTTHGHTKNHRRSPEHVAYSNMLTRCYRVNGRQYKDYGGRGVQVFPDWLGPGGFERWLAHIGPMPTPGLTQDRKDNDKDYAPGNVRWATREEQCSNKRNNRYLTHVGETKTLVQWARLVGISQGAISQRLQRGWSVGDALTKPPRKITKKAAPVQ